MRIIGVIPARYQSTRFPGKPLVDIAGKSMIQRVYEQAQKASSLADVVVATDHSGIADHVKAFGGNVLLTREDHQSGTDRCQEVVEQLEELPEAVINIQGDEPFIQPEQIDLVAACFQDKNVELATLVKVIDNELVLNDPNTPKVVLDSESNAIYFSRQAIPYLRDVPESDWLKSHIFYKHIGIYGYLTDSLKKITQLKPSILERAEALEQLRWLENGYRVRVKETQFESEGIDTPEQLQEIISRLVKG